MKNILAAIGLIALIGFVFNWVSSDFHKWSHEYDNYTKPTSISSDAVETKQEVKAINYNNLSVVTPQMLISSYDDNTVAADNMYKGKLFKIKGNIENISTDVLDEASVTMLGTEENLFNNVMAKFSTENKNQLIKLHKGDEVVLICIGAGDVMKRPILKKCEVSNDNSQPKSSNESLPLKQSEAKTEAKIPPTYKFAANAPKWCAKHATIKSDFIVCADSELSDLDLKVLNKYKYLKGRLNGESLITLNKITFKEIGNRRNCTDKQCILNSYNSEITDLSKRISASIKKDLDESKLSPSSGIANDKTRN